MLGDERMLLFFHHHVLDLCCAFAELTCKVVNQ